MAAKKTPNSTLRGVYLDFQLKDALFTEKLAENRTLSHPLLGTVILLRFTNFVNLESSRSARQFLSNKLLRTKFGPEGWAPVGEVKPVHGVQLWAYVTDSEGIPEFAHRAKKLVALFLD